MPRCQTASNEEATLWRDYFAFPTQKNRDALVYNYEGLVRAIATNLNPPPNQFDDYVQVGFIGLINAIDRFDPKFGTKFSSFAAPTIIGEIRRYRRDFLDTIRDRKGVDAIPLYYRAVSCFYKVYGRNPENDTELATFLGCSAEAVCVVREIGIHRNLASIDAPTSDHDEDRGFLLDLIADGTPDPYQQTEDLAMRIAIDSLPDDRQRLLIKWYFYQELSQHQISALLGISQNHVSRLQRKAIKWLREHFGVNELDAPIQNEGEHAAKFTSRHQYISEFVLAVKQKEQELCSKTSQATVALGKSTSKMQTTQNGGNTPAGTQSQINVVHGAPDLFGTALIAFHLTQHGKSVHLKSDSAMKEHKPNGRELDTLLVRLANENLLVEVGVGTGFYKRGGRYFMVCNRLEGESRTDIEILPTIFPGLRIEFGKPYNLVNVVVNLKCGEQQANKTSAAAVPPALATASQAATPSALSVGNRQNVALIPLLPPSQAAALIVIWQKTQEGKAVRFSVAEASREAGLKPSQVFDAMPKLEEAGFFTRPAKGVFSRGSVTAFRCAYGAVKTDEICVLPDRYPDLRLEVGQVYDIADLVSKITKQPVVAMAATTPLIIPSSVPDSLSESHDIPSLVEGPKLSGSELDTLPGLALPPVSRISGNGTSIDGEIAARQNYLESLASFRAKLQEALRKVDDYEIETKRDIDTLEAARKVLERPLPGLQA